MLFRLVLSIFLQIFILILIITRSPVRIVILETHFLVSSSPFSSGHSVCGFSVLSSPPPPSPLSPPQPAPPPPPPPPRPPPPPPLPVRFSRVSSPLPCKRG